MPPLPMMYSATCRISTTSECRRVRITSSTPRMSSAIGAKSSEIIGWREKDRRSKKKRDGRRPSPERQGSTTVNLFYPAG
ncbi:MAG: hypothetical protein MZW92_80600 [Comamonadaceae bacterium]|nr:hypothetical protein [Comamonadaceae bacterium]